ncbi:carotenoid biosynthesis protein [Flammeovirga sp. SubArs3]|uniref:carotenoid biosynthesis protein n=1 Tax=Flammeovirga sp. SubArs3 TaxID=2995316 RepID=UPI00248CDFAF|nr:carotenoid biosynthesis protein [Flammeovirga sp. SubArs3]
MNDLTTQINSQFRKLTNLAKSKILLTIFYTVGAVVAFTPLNRLLLPFTPFLLFSSFVILLSFEEKKNSVFAIWLLFTYCSSFFIEWHGVHFGVLFGDYIYLNNLGFKIDGVPFLIPINWIILAIAGVELSKTTLKKLPLFFQVILSSLIVVMLDVLIEIVCEPLGFWQWDNGMPPFKNYFSWWFFMCIFIYLKLKFLDSKNPLSIYLFILFFGYFFFQVIASLL